MHRRFLFLSFLTLSAACSLTSETDDLDAQFGKAGDAGAPAAGASGGGGEPMAGTSGSSGQAGRGGAGGAAGAGAGGAGAGGAGGGTGGNSGVGGVGAGAGGEAGTAGAGGAGSGGAGAGGGSGSGGAGGGGTGGAAGAGAGGGSGTGGQAGGSGGQGGASPVCGNGKLETGESCDENDFGDRSCASELKNANAEGSLLCSNNCTISTASCFIPPYCGDGIKQDNEECDDGNGDNTDACTSACKATCAGPGYFREEGTGHCYVYSLNDGSSWQNAREECFKLGPGFDLAALSTADELEFVLKSLNTLPTKSDEIWIGGNDLKKEGEYAWTNGEAWNYPINQPPWLGPPHPSSSYDCLKLSELMGLETGFCLSSRPFLCERRSLSENLCRDGNINPNVEECDDGNASNSDACINSCQAAKCGDGFTRTGVEECDDGNASNTDSCTTECKAAKCGDGFVRTGVEECDDGNQVNTDACVTGCKNAACGDGFVRAGVEECDDGNQVNTDACIQGCKAAQCGDGFVQAGVEQCDDGNLLNGDGCNSACSGPLGRSVPGAIPGLRGGKKSVSLRDAIRSS